MDTEPQPRPSISISGGVHGQNVLVGSTQTVHGDLSIAVGELPAASPEVRKALEEQIGQLLQALEQVPVERGDDVRDVKLAVEDAVAEANMEAPNTDRLRSRGSALTRVAERIADVAPSVLTFATQVAATIAALS